MLKMCCYHYYLHLTEQWGRIPLEIRLQRSLSYQNIVSLFYKEKIILLNKSFSNKYFKNNTIPQFNLRLKFENITVTETQSVENRYHSLQEEYQRVWKIRNDLEVKNDIIKDELDIIKDKLFKKEKLNKRLINILTIYKYHELNNVQKYNYEEIKEKNKKLNSEFKRVAKLMKLNN
jgi:hypothetical protein